VTTTVDEGRAAARGILALGGLQTIGRGLAFAFVVVATRTLAPSHFGRYSIVAAIVGVGGTLADFGTTPAIMRRVSARPESSDQLLANTLPACFALGLLAYSGAVIFAAVAGYAAVTRGDVAIGALALPADAVLTSVLAAMDGRGRISRRAAISFLRVALMTGGGAVALLAGLGVRWALAALAAGPAVALVVSVVSSRRAELWRGRLAPRWDETRALLSDAVPFAVHGGLYGLILRFDVVLLSLMATRAATAKYDVASRVIEGVTFLGPVLAAPALFLLTRRLEAGDHVGAQRGFDKAGRLAYLIAAPISVGLMALSRPLVWALFGHRYGSAATPLAIMAAPLCLAFIIGLQVSLVQGAGHAAATMGLAAVNTAIVVGLDVALIPHYGATGAAVAMAAYQVVAVVLFARYIRSRLEMVTPLPQPGVVAAALLAGAAAWRLPIVPAVLVGAAVYVGVLAVTRTVTASDLAELRSLGRS
jgi:O-antigen/teichoic acid export membrane protein